jgi:hypothetical protein
MAPAFLSMIGTCVSCATLFLISSGACGAQTIPEEFRVRPGKVVDKTTWPGDVKRIVAVTYDFERDKIDDVVIDGRLHKGIFMTSADLTPEQTEKLYSAITGTHTHQKGAVCFQPHHGFVFYGASGEILGSISLCFGCVGYRHAPQGEVSKVFDIKALEELVMELKMPILEDPKQKWYPALFDEFKARQDGNDLPKVDAPPENKAQQKSKD